jgi:hypothetical protein
MATSNACSPEADSRVASPSDPDCAPAQAPLPDNDYLQLYAAL